MNNKLKTQQNEGSVNTFLTALTDTEKRKDALRLCELMSEATGKQPIMWGSSIVGFGSYHYKYASGREGDWMKIGFSPRKAGLTVYLMDGFDKHQSLLSNLGKHKTAKSCLYIKSLNGIDLGVLRQIIRQSYNSPAMGEG